LPGVNNVVAAFFPLVCSNCGGAGHDINNCSSARGGSQPADSGTSRPQATDRNMRFRGRPGDRSPGSTRGGRPAGSNPSANRRGDRWSVRPATPVQPPRNQRVTRRNQAGAGTQLGLFFMVTMTWSLQWSPSLFTAPSASSPR
jgi:hypothetical protein